MSDSLCISGISFRWSLCKTVLEIWSSLLKSENKLLSETSERGSFKLPYSMTWLKGLDQFDPLLFRISPREAVWMDPSQRVLLECTFEALEQCTDDVENFGVYVGCNESDYTICALTQKEGSEFQLHGNAKAAVAGRISYFFGCHGPSISLDAACASGLVGLKLGCNDIEGGETSGAIISCCSVVAHSQTALGYFQGGFLAKDGRCKTFDARADGFGRAEGSGCIVVQKRSTSRSCLLNIVAGGIGHDGSSKDSFESVSQDSLRRLFENVRKKITKENVSLILPHGNGSPVSDEAEACAISSSYGTLSKPLVVCATKTITSNTEAAAGILSCIVAILSSENSCCPSQALFQNLNDSIGISRMQNAVICLALERIDWNHQNIVSSVTAFGFGGAQGHFIFSKDKCEASDSFLSRMVLSTNNDSNFRSVASRWRVWLIEKGSLGSNLESRVYFPPFLGVLKRAIVIMGKTTKDLQNGLSAVEEKGALARGLVGVSHLSTVCIKQEKVALYCGSNTESNFMKNFLAMKSMGDRLHSIGVEFLENGMGVGSSSFSCLAILKKTKEEQAKSLLRNSKAKGRKFIRVFAQRQNDFENSFSVYDRLNNGSAVILNSKKEANAVYCQGHRFTYFYQETLSEIEEENLLREGIGSRLFHYKKQHNVSILIGRWPEIERKIRSDGGHIILTNQFERAHSDLITLGCCVSKLSRTRYQNSNICVPPYPFLHRKIWPKPQSVVNNSVTKGNSVPDGLSQVYGLCDFCHENIFGRDLVISSTSNMLHQHCVEKFESENASCSFCQKKLLQDERVSSFGETFHKNCFENNFQCNFCFTGIKKDSVVLYNEKRYHGECVLKARQNQVKCKYCDKFLDDQYIWLNDEKIHIKCLSIMRKVEAQKMQEKLKATKATTEAESSIKVRRRPVSTATKAIIGDTIEERCVSILSHVLDVDENDLKMEAQLKSFGFSSLSSVKTKTLVKVHLGVILPTNFTNEFLTIRDMISFVKTHGGTLNSEADLEQGIALSKEECEKAWLKFVHNVAPKPMSSSKKLDDEKSCILLTGSSGFLGAEILKFFSDNTNRIVYCIVRAKSSSEASDRLKGILGPSFNSSRIKVFCGDLDTDLFGLEQAVYDSIGRNCCLVLHCAALVNWTAPYDFLKSANVDGTARVLKFGVEFQAQVAFISTLGVLSPFASFPRYDETVDLSALDEIEYWKNIPSNQRGYVQSKYVGELLVKKFKEKLPAIIIRVPFLGPSMKSGRCSNDQYDIRLFMTFINSKSYFRPVRRVAKLNWVPVDYCAEFICKASLITDEITNIFHDGVLHVAHPLGGTAISQIVRCFESFGYRMDAVPKSVWLKNVEKGDFPAKPFMDLLDLELDELPTHWTSCRFDQVSNLCEFNPNFKVTNNYIFQMCQYLSSQHETPVPCSPESNGVDLDYAIQPLNIPKEPERQDGILLRSSFLKVLVHFLLCFILVLFVSIPIYPAILFIDWTFKIAWWGIFLIPVAVNIHAGSTSILLILFKWILLWRIRPGRHKLWSFFFCRWWLVRNMQRIAGLTVLGKGWLEGTIFSWIIYRLLGAQVHMSVHIGGELHDFDLIQMDVSSGFEESIRGHTFEAGNILVLDKVTVCKGSWVGMGAYLEPGAILQEDCKLAEGSILTKEDSTENIRLNSLLVGVNPLEISRKSFRPNIASENVFLYLVRSILMVTLRSYVLISSFAPAIYLFFFISDSIGSVQALFSIVGLIPSIMLAYLFEIIVLKWLLLGSGRCCGDVKEYHWKGWYSFRREIFLCSFNALGPQCVGILAYSVWGNMFLRILGANIGPGSHIGAINCWSEFDFVSVERNAFLGSSVRLQCWSFEDSKLHISPVEIGKNSFISDDTIICAPAKLQSYSQVLPGSVVKSKSVGESVQVAGRPSFPVCMNEQSPPIPPGRNVFVDFVLSIIFWAALTFSIICSFVCAQITFFALNSLSSSSYLLVLFYINVCCALFFCVFGVSSIVSAIFVFTWIEGLMSKKSKNIQLLKLRSQMISLVAISCYALGGTCFSSFFWSLLGSKIGENCFIDPEGLVDPKKFKCDDNCIVRGKINQSFSENNDKRQLGVFLENGVVVNEGSIIVDSFHAGESSLVLPSSVPDGMTFYPAYSKVKGVFQGPTKR